jgi:hypothetical protein
MIPSYASMPEQDRGSLLGESSASCPCLAFSHFQSTMSRMEQMVYTYLRLVQIIRKEYQTKNSRNQSMFQSLIIPGFVKLTPGTFRRFLKATSWNFSLPKPSSSFTQRLKEVFAISRMNTQFSAFATPVLVIQETNNNDIEPVIHSNHSSKEEDNNNEAGVRYVPPTRYICVCVFVLCFAV